MALIIWGIKTATIGMDECIIRCPACEAHNFADVMIVSKYLHIYFVPIVPFTKEANIICHKCGLKRYNVPFEKRLFSNFDEVKNRFKHPWYTYAFLIFVFLVILVAVLLDLFDI